MLFTLLKKKVGDTLPTKVYDVSSASSYFGHYSDG